MSEKTYTCGYTHCLHKNEKMNEEDSVLVGKGRFHKDCAEVRGYIDTLKDMYFDHINEKANYIEVLSVINNIVFKKGIDPRYMIFALQYIIKKNARIKSPYSLHYLPDNKTIQNLWKKEVSNPDNR
jgi:hypothetical protein